MIELPKEFKQSIINRYAEKGIEWLNSIDKIVEKYEKKFSLYNMHLVEKLSMNIVILANSDKYGEVVLKIGTPGKSVISEIEYISLFNSKCFAKCYYYNKEDRVMLLEKINPGYDLSCLKNQQERVNVFCEVLNNIMVPSVSNTSFRTYEEIIEEKIETVYSDKQDYSNILYMIDIVNELYNEIKRMNLPKYILHEDLQHKNILKSEDGWKAIDPHGTIGEKIFETTQFIRGELEYTSVERLDEIVTLVSKFLKEDKILIYKALYITIFEKIVFFIKAKYDTNFIDYNIKVCEKIYKYIK